MGNDDNVRGSGDDADEDEERGMSRTIQPLSRNRLREPYEDS